MDVNAIAQATQNQASAPQQDSGGTPAGDLFAFLLKHSFGSAVGTHSLLNTQAMLDMVGSAHLIAPPTPAPPPAPPPQTNTSAQGQSNQSASSGNGGNQPAGPMTVTAANSNGGQNSGAGSQSNNSQQGQQGSAQSNSSNGSAATTPTTTAASAPAQTVTGEDQATEETAAVLAAAIYVVQQVQTQAAPVDPAAPVMAAAQNAAGPQQQGTGPATTQGPGTSGQPIMIAAAEDAEESGTPLWSLNFLSSGPATPQIAQQAASLAQTTGPSGATISVQTTSGDAVGPTNTGTLVPDAVLAIPGFFADGQQGSSTGGNTGDQSNTQQNTDQSAQDAVVDPTALMLAQDLQAMSAISALLQSAGQSLIATQQGAAGVSAVAVAAATSAAEAALPQPAATQGNTPMPTNFINQLQEAEQTQAPEAPKQIQLPSAVDQIKMQIEKGLQQGSTTIKVQLTPENMGRVDVKLDVQNGTVKATITADRPETLALLKSDQSGMLQALTDAGLNADSSSLSFYLRGDQQQRQFAQTGRQGRNQSGGAAADDPMLAGIAATAGVSSNAAAGALDISV